jgi:hypothetical protein
VVPSYEQGHEYIMHALLGPHGVTNCGVQVAHRGGGTWVKGGDELLGEVASVESFLGQKQFGEEGDDKLGEFGGQLEAEEGL